MFEVKKLFAKEQVDPDVGFRCRLIDGKKDFFEYHYHDYYELFLTLDDGVVHYVNEKKIDLPKNSLVFIRPQDKHGYKNDNSSFFFYNISFTQEIYKQLKDYLGSIFFDGFENLEYPPVFNLSEKDVEWIKKGFKNLNQITFDDKSLKLLKFKYFILRVFIDYIICGDFQDLICMPHQDVPIWLKEYMSRIRTKECFSLPYKEIVALSGKNVDYLNRSCKKHYNITINSYINNLRLNYVANMLISSNLKIIDLFFDAGFEDVSWATVLFKKKYSVSPSEFRKINERN